MCHIIFFHFNRKKSVATRLLEEIYGYLHISKHANGTFVSDEAKEIGVSSILIKSIIFNHT